MKQKPCEVDRETVFKEKELNTTHCQVCDCYVKSYRFRSCEYRHAKELEQGNDVLDIIKESNRLAVSQTGKKILPVDGVQPVGVSEKKEDKVGAKQAPKRHRRGR